FALIGATSGGAGEADEDVVPPDVPWIAWRRWCSRRQPSQLARWDSVSAFSSGVNWPETSPPSLDLAVAQSTKRASPQGASQVPTTPKRRSNPYRVIGRTWGDLEGLAAPPGARPGP